MSYVTGKYAALELYGVKTAGWLSSAGSTARNMFVGEPGTWAALKNQAQKGTLFHPHQGKPLEQGLYNAHSPSSWLIPTINFGNKGDGLVSRAGDTLNTALSVMNPLSMAYSGYQALKAPPEQRGEATGRLLGGVVGGTVGAPFGLAGNMAGSILGDMAGGAVGKQVGEAVLPKRSPYEE